MTFRLNYQLRNSLMRVPSIAAADVGFQGDVAQLGIPVTKRCTRAGQPEILRDLIPHPVAWAAYARLLSQIVKLGGNGDPSSATLYRFGVGPCRTAKTITNDSGTTVRETISSGSAETGRGFFGSGWRRFACRGCRKLQGCKGW